MLPVLGMLGLIAAALVAGTAIYLTVRLTAAYLKKYRLKKNSKIIAAKFKDLIKQAPTKKLDDLIDDDDVILAEYDEDEDTLVQDIRISHSQDVGDSIKDILNANSGIVVFE